MFIDDFWNFGSVAVWHCLSAKYALTPHRSLLGHNLHLMSDLQVV